MALGPEPPWAMIATPSNHSRGAPAIPRIIQTSISLAQRLPTQEITKATHEISSKGILQHVHNEARHSFHGFERNIAGKAIAHHHINLPTKDISALDITDIIQTGRRKLFARGPRQIIPLPFLFAVAP